MTRKLVSLEEKGISNLDISRLKHGSNGGIYKMEERATGLNGGIENVRMLGEVGLGLQPFI